MNNNFKFLAAAMLSGSIIFSSGCTLQKMIKMAKQQKLAVTPSPLELHGDSVKFDVSGNVPKKMLKKKTTYSILVNYEYGNPKAGTQSLGEATFPQKDFADNKSKETPIKKGFAFKYEDKHERGQVSIQGKATKGGKSKSTPDMPVENAIGVITTSRLVMPAIYANYLPHGYVYKEEYQSSYYDFYFEKAKSELRKSEINSDRGKNLDLFIAGKNATKTVSIIGSHSPEGSETINTELSGDRAKAIEEFYRQEMNKYDYKDMASKIQFVLKPVIQDWTEFKKLLAANTKITEKQKGDILAIVNGSGSFVEKELKLQKLNSYKALLKEIYPTLRTAKAEIVTPVAKMTEAEIAVLGIKIGKGQEDASKLTQQELAYAAFKTPDLKEKEGIYKASIAKYDNYADYNNLGAVYLQMADKENDATKKAQLLDMAIQQLEMGIKKQPSGDSYANLASAKIAKGDKAGALEAIKAAQGTSSSGGATQTMNFFKGYTEITAGNYPSAIASFAGAGDNQNAIYNKGLAHLLSKQYDQASASFDEVLKKNPTHAYANYLQAIVGARTNNENKVSTFLAAAVKAMPSLKEKAVKDLEFRGFWDKESFKTAMK